MVSQSGTNLSGGQKQRLAIARALIRPAEFYIFDDSFSALDFRTDARLRAAIREHFKDANLIIVAQRVGTILDADRIIVLDEGKVAGIGTHRELLENCRVYQTITTRAKYPYAKNGVAAVQQEAFRADRHFFNASNFI